MHRPFLGMNLHSLKVFVNISSFFISLSWGISFTCNKAAEFRRGQGKWVNGELPPLCLRHIRNHRSHRCQSNRTPAKKNHPGQGVLPGQWVKNGWPPWHRRIRSNHIQVKKKDKPAAKIMQCGEKFIWLEIYPCKISVILWRVFLSFNFSQMFSIHSDMYHEYNVQKDKRDAEPAHSPWAKLPALTGHTVSARSYTQPRARM